MRSRRAGVSELLLMFGAQVWRTRDWRRIRSRGSNIFTSFAIFRNALKNKKLSLYIIKYFLNVFMLCNKNTVLHKLRHRHMLFLLEHTLLQAYHHWKRIFLSLACSHHSKAHCMFFSCKGPSRHRGKTLIHIRKRLNRYDVK